MIARALTLILCSWLTGQSAYAAAAGSALLKAKQEAEAKGYVSFTSRDEIVSKAKKEGKLRVVAGDASALKAVAEAFRKRYPFIDLHAESTTGIESIQRFLLEIKSGAAKEWDTTKIETTLYREYLPHLWKVDLLGMAEQGVLDIAPQMVDPTNQNIIASSTRFEVIAYNKNLVSPGQIPKTWEDMLKPQWKGRKFGADPRPQLIATLVPLWGLEKALNYARKIAAQEPVWIQGGNRAVGTVVSGETPLFLGPTYSIVRRHQSKDPLGVIQYGVLEPVPVRTSGEQGILATAGNPHAALLWLEFVAGTEAQKLLDQHEPMVASLYTKGSAVEQELRGKRLSVISWENNEKMDQWLAKLVEASGFPKTERK
jgi:iron(III) transport system substrate-binding protein